MHSQKGGLTIDLMIKPPLRECKTNQKIISKITSIYIRKYMLEVETATKSSLELNLQTLFKLI